MKFSHYKYICTFPKPKTIHTWILWYERNCLDGSETKKKLVLKGERGLVMVLVIWSESMIYNLDSRDFSTFGNFYLLQWFRNLKASIRTWWHYSFDWKQKQKKNYLQLNLKSHKIPLFLLVGLLVSLLLWNFSLCSNN